MWGKFASLVLLVSGISSSAEILGKISAGHSQQGYVAYLEHNTYFADTSSISIPFEINIQLQIDDGDADLYVSDQGVAPSRDDFKWSSVTADSSRNESLVFSVESAAQNISFSIFGAQNTAYVLSFTLNSVDAISKPIQNGTTLGGNFTPGFFQMIETSIAESGFYKVTFDLYSEPKEQRLSREYLSLRLGLESEDVALSQRAGYNGTALNSFSGSTWEMTAKRGISTTNGALSGTANFGYVHGGNTFAISLSAGTNALASDEDQLIPFSLEMVVSEVETLCLGETGTVGLGTQVVDGQTWQFFSMSKPHQGYLRIALAGLAGEWYELDLVDSTLSIFVSTNITYPMTDADAFFSAVRCQRSECVLTIPAPADANVTLDDPCAATSSQLYIGVMSDAIASHTSRFSLSVMGLDDLCGWRPSCQSCAQGGQECSWCNDGGYCSRTADLAYQVCDSKAVWCVEETCSALADPCDCMATSGCGWCGDAEEPGVCTQANDDGTNSLHGYCDLWMGEANISTCSDVCSAHEISELPCEPCTQDPLCGICVNAAGLTCVIGNEEGANSSTCSSFYHSSDSCATITADPEEQTIVAGQAYTTFLVASSNACGLEICDHATYAYTVPQYGSVLDVQLAVTVSPADAAVSLYSRYGEVASDTVYDHVGVQTHKGESYATYLLVSSLCDTANADAIHFAVYATGAHGDVVELEVMATELQTTVALDTEGAELLTLSGEYGGLGALRHYMVELMMPDKEKDHERELRVEVLPASQGEGLVTLYARYGACATSGKHDSMFTQSSIGQPVFLNELFSTGASAWWYISIDSKDSLFNFSLTLIQIDNGGDNDDDIGGASSWVVWLTVALCILVVMLVSAGYLYYDYKHAQTCYLPADMEKGSLAGSYTSPLDFISPVISDDFLEQEGLVEEQEAMPDKKKKDEDEGIKVRQRAFTVGALPNREGIPVKPRADLGEIVDPSITAKRAIPDIGALMASIKAVSSGAASGLAGPSSPAVKVGAVGPGGIPPPPPPPPGMLKGALTKRRMTMYGELVRDPNVVKEFQNLRRLDNKFYLDLDDDEDAGNKAAASIKSKTSSKKGDLLGELKRKSTHHVQVEQEREEYGEMLTDLAAESKSFAPRNMDEAVQFIQKVDEALEVFSDEREVLKGLEDWPEARVDLLREAGAMYKELTSMKTLLVEMNGSQVEGESFYAHAAAAFDRVQKRVEIMAITQDNDLKRFTNQGIPWTKQLLDDVIHASLKFGENYLMKALTDIATLRSHPRFTVEMDEKVKWLLDAGVRTGFRVHQFAGGFNPTCTVLFNEIAKLRREQQDTAASAEQ